MSNITMVLKVGPYQKNVLKDPLIPAHPLPFHLSIPFPPTLYEESIIFISALFFLNFFCTNEQIFLYFPELPFSYMKGIIDTCFLLYHLTVYPRNDSISSPRDLPHS